MTWTKERLIRWYQRLRIIQFHFLSDSEIVHGNPVVHQPVLFLGRGQIRFTGESHLGVFLAPYFLNGYIHIEARSPESVVDIGEAVYINNNSSIVSNGAGIYIGNRSMLGTNCEIIDSDFHSTRPDRRLNGNPKTGKVVIGENVMIGSNVKIFKGVRIGDNSVIANGSVVTRSIPANMLAYGNPARAGHLYVPEMLRERSKASLVEGGGMTEMRR